MKVTHTTEKRVTEVPMVTITMTQEEADLLKDISRIVFYNLMCHSSEGSRFLHGLHEDLGGNMVYNEDVARTFPCLNKK